MAEYKTWAQRLKLPEKTILAVGRVSEPILFDARLLEALWDAGVSGWELVAPLITYLIAENSNAGEVIRGGLKSGQTDFVVRALERSMDERLTGGELWRTIGPRDRAFSDLWMPDEDGDRPRPIAVAIMSCIDTAANG